MSKSFRLVLTYATGMGVYGYYRGYNNLYDSNKYNTQEILLTDRIVNGLYGCIWQLNPIMQPMFMYGIIRRYEKRTLKMIIYKYDYKD